MLSPVPEGFIQRPNCLQVVVLTVVAFRGGAKISSFDVAVLVPIPILPSDLMRSLSCNDVVSPA